VVFLDVAKQNTDRGLAFTLFANLLKNLGFRDDIYGYMEFDLYLDGTNFSYIDKETQEEFFVGLAEEKGSHIIENTPLAPGVCYTSTSDGESVALVRIEAVAVQGSGKLNITGINTVAVKENIKNT
jgi:predicted ATP-dependent Lon-type protease